MPANVGAPSTMLLITHCKGRVDESASKGPTEYASQARRRGWGLSHREAEDTQPQRFYNEAEAENSDPPLPL